jgi:hypothetical protein
MFSVPDDFRTGPFRRSRALRSGIPARVLEGVQFRRLHKGVYCHRHHAMTFEDWITAALLALPDRARTTGITRLQQGGLDHGPRAPLHFVVEGDLHLTLEGVFLHRTVLMPPHDDDGVTIEAAFIAYCAEARVIDVIKVGSLLRHTGEMSLEKLEALVAEQPWRRGAVETRWVLPHLDDRCRSLPEAELLALLRFAGLPEPEVNRTVELAPGRPVTPDLWWERYRCAAEYEGSQHQEDRGQYNADIDRYLLYRRNDAGYAQVTKERLRSPRAAVRHVHAELVDRGYDGPSPDFGELWSPLFTRLSDVVRPGRVRRAA